MSSALVFELATETAKFTAGINTAKSQIAQIDRDAANAGKGLFSNFSLGNAGRGSSFDEFGKTLEGKGRLLGLTLVSRMLDESAKKAAEVSAQFQKGEISASGMVGKIAEGLPILGGFVSAGQSIRSIFSAENEVQAAIVAEDKAADAALRSQVEVGKMLLHGARELKSATAESRHEIELALAPLSQQKSLEDDYAQSIKQAAIEQARLNDLQAIKAAARPRDESIAAAEKAAREAKDKAEGGLQDVASVTSAKFLRGLAVIKAAFGASSDIRTPGQVVGDADSEIARVSQLKQTVNKSDADAQKIVEDRARQRREDAAFASAVKQSREVGDIEEARNEKQFYDAQATAIRIADAQSAARVSRLREAGDNEAADAEQLARELADRLNAIEQDRLKRNNDASFSETQVNNRNAALEAEAAKAENAARANQKLADARRAANAEVAGFAKAVATTGNDEVDFIAKLLERNRADLERAKASGASNQELDIQSAKQDKLTDLEIENHRIEEANRLRQEAIDPLERYKRELEEINDLAARGLIDDQTKIANITKANTELENAAKAASGDGTARTEQRRFDFRINPGQQAANPLGALAKTAAEQKAAQDKGNFYLQWIYQYQQNANNAPVQTIDF